MILPLMTMTSHSHFESLFRCEHLMIAPSLAFRLCTKYSVDSVGVLVMVKSAFTSEQLCRQGEESGQTRQSPILVSTLSEGQVMDQYMLCPCFNPVQVMDVGWFSTISKLLSVLHPVSVYEYTENMTHVFS